MPDIGHTSPLRTVSAKTVPSPPAAPVRLPYHLAYSWGCAPQRERKVATLVVASEGRDLGGTNQSALDCAYQWHRRCHFYTTPPPPPPFPSSHFYYLFHPQTVNYSSHWIVNPCSIRLHLLSKAATSKLVRNGLKISKKLEFKNNKITRKLFINVKSIQCIYSEN